MNSIETGLEPVDRSHLAPRQIELVEHALRQLAKISRTGWDTIPTDLKPHFAKYMDKEVWTGEVDLFTLREAALMILRDAITRTGEFSGSDTFRGSAQSGS